MPEYDARGILNAPASRSVQLPSQTCPTNSQHGLMLRYGCPDCNDGDVRVCTSCQIGRFLAFPPETCMLPLLPPHDCTRHEDAVASPPGLFVLKERRR